MGLHRPVEAFADVRQNSQPSLAISVTMVDIFVPITPEKDVVAGISEFKTETGGTCPNFSQDVMLKDLTRLCCDNAITAK